MLASSSQKGDDSSRSRVLVRSRSSHKALGLGEDNEEASLFGLPAHRSFETRGFWDEEFRKGTRTLFPRPKTPRLYGPKDKELAALFVNCKMLILRWLRGPTVLGVNRRFEIAPDKLLRCGGPVCHVLPNGWPHQQAGRLVWEEAAFDE